LKKYGLFSEKNDAWQDQCEICIYLIGSTDYLAFGAAGKILRYIQKGIQQHDDMEV
jgi:hypothetical protein